MVSIRKGGKTPSGIDESVKTFTLNMEKDIATAQNEEVKEIDMNKNKLNLMEELEAKCISTSNINQYSVSDNKE